MKKFLAAIMAFVMLIACIPASAEGVSFPDVKESAWYHDAVTYCAEKGIFNGNKDGSFAPNKSITRAEFAVVLANYSGEDYSAEKTDMFKSDIKPSHWFYSAIAWANNHDIVSGVDSNHFVPTREITRQDICVMLSRYLAYKAINVDYSDAGYFADSGKISLYAFEAVMTVKKIGVISGMGNNMFDPKGSATRAQVAQMMMQFDKFMEGADSTMNMERVTIKIPGVETPVKFMHLSDSHLTLFDETDSEKAVSEMIRRGQMFDNQVGDGIKREDKLAQFYEIAAKEEVDQILLSGDIIDAPSNGNMKFFSELVAGSEIPSLYCLGNHDWTFEDPYQVDRELYIPGFRDIFGNDEENWWDEYLNVYEYDGFVLVAVDNSNDQVPSVVTSVLKTYARAGMPVILMLHVPVSCESAVADVSAMWGRDITIGSAALNPNATTKQFVEFIRSAESSVVAILAGHTHLSHVDDVSPNNDTVQYTLGATFEGYARIFEIVGE